MTRTNPNIKILRLMVLRAMMTVISKEMLEPLTMVHWMVYITKI